MNQNVWIKIPKNISSTNNQESLKCIVNKLNGKKRVLYCFNKYILYGKVDIKIYDRWEKLQLNT